MSRESRIPRILGIALATFGAAAVATSAWNLLVTLGPSSVQTSVDALLEAAATRPRELLVVLQAGHSVYAGGAGLVAVAVGFLLLRLSQPAGESGGQPARSVLSHR